MMQAHHGTHGTLLWLLNDCARADGASSRCTLALARLESPADPPPVKKEVCESERA